MGGGSKRREGESKGAPLRDRVGLGGGSDVSKCLYLIWSHVTRVVTAFPAMTPPYQLRISHGILIGVSELLVLSTLQ